MSDEEYNATLTECLETMRQLLEEEKIESMKSRAAASSQLSKIDPVCMFTCLKSVYHSFLLQCEV